MTEHVLWLVYDARRAKRQGAPVMEQRQRARLADMVAFARTRSPLYRHLYRGLPERVEDPGRLPVTTKQQLMEAFDDWVTDPAVTVDRVRRFVDDPELIGERIFGRYLVTTTSGTSGTRGLFVIDDRSLAVANALVLRMLGAWLDPGDVTRIVAGRGRLAMVIATGGHFASIVAATRLRRTSRRRARTIAVFPVHQPLAEIVTGLNRFRPAILAPYASLGAMLADEQAAGRLRIQPGLVVLSAEGLPEGEYRRIAEAFGAKVRHGYAATECPFLSYSCPEGWLHVNADWLTFEPVDADHRPVPPGEESHTVLVSNLANRVQPILRYDLGDRILTRPDPCPCGNPPPAIRVRGRAADVLTFPTRDGEQVRLAPLVFGGLADRTPGVERFQIVQTTPTNLRISVRAAAGADPDRVAHALHAELTRLLADHQLHHITVEPAAEDPEPSPAGKYRSIVPLVRQPGPSPA